MRAPVSFVAIQPWAAGTSPTIAMSRDEVHVWRASLNQPQEHFVRLMRILSPQERVRAERFHFEVDRKRCILARALLRLLLGRSLGTSPHLVRFRHSDLGKPRLPPALHPLLQFNLSHSGDLVLIALSRGRELGVDVEQIRMDVATENIAAHFFSENERRDLASVPPVLQREAFFACWTRKEAYVKARGDGLSLRLEQFDVSFLQEEEPRLVETRHDPAEVDRWTMRALKGGCGYEAALVVEGADWELKCWDLPATAVGAMISHHPDSRA